MSRPDILIGAIIFLCLMLLIRFVIAPEIVGNYGIIGTVIALVALYAVAVFLERSDRKSG